MAVMMADVIMAVVFFKIVFIQASPKNLDFKTLPIKRVLWWREIAC